MRYYFEERTKKIFRWRRRTTIVSTLNEDIKQTKEDDITFPVTPLVSQVSLQNLYTKAKNRNLWSKIIQQVVKLAYSRWLRWSMPHSDQKEKRLRNVKKTRSQRASRLARSGFFSSDRYFSFFWVVISTMYVLLFILGKCLLDFHLLFLIFTKAWLYNFDVSQEDFHMACFFFH